MIVLCVGFQYHKATDSNQTIYTSWLYWDNIHIICTTGRTREWGKFHIETKGEGDQGILVFYCFIPMGAIENADKILTITPD